MSDAIRPGKEEFDRVLSDSHTQWLSYLKDANTTPTLPLDCVDLKSIVQRTPSFLGYGLLSESAKVSFTCVDKESSKEHHGLLASGWSFGRYLANPATLIPKSCPWIYCSQFPIR